MRSLIPFELLTAILYAYLAVSLPWNTAASIINALHFVTVAIAGVVIAIGAWRGARWVAKVSVALAAVVGIPVLSMVGVAIHLMRGLDSPAVPFAFALTCVGAICQLMALIIGLRHLQVRGAAV